MPVPSSAFVEILTIGEELLIGQVVDTNSAWLGQRLNEIGLRVKRITSVSDDQEEILSALRQAEDRASVVIITGGLGPTKDDITKKCLCEYFSCGLRFHEESYENIRRIFAARGREVSALNRGQAELPSACKPVLNVLGTAPGMWFDKEDKVFISLPGVPYEMKGLVQGSILKMLADRFGLPPVLHRTLLTQGVGESMIAEKIEVWENALPDQVRLAYLPSPGLVRLRLSVSGLQEKESSGLLDRYVAELSELVADHLFGFDDDTLEELVGSLLRSMKRTVVTAESCTGGYLSHRLTSVPGSSDYFLGSIIAYDNAIKSSLLDVPDELIVRHGAVSEEVVTAMANNARLRFNADFALATSGVAGPGGGTPDKPVGTVHVALAGPDGTEHLKLRLGDHRERNIRETALHAMNLLRKRLVREAE